MKAAALIAFMLAGGYYFLQASLPLLKNQCRLPVFVYCGDARTGNLAEVTKDGKRVLEVRCANE